MDPDYEFERRQKLIGDNWKEYSELKRMTTVSLIDHMLWCLKRGTECLNRKPYREEGEHDPGAKWAAFNNQKMWCLQVLKERGVYDADPYRDDKGNYQYMDDEA